jgi:hypothetical protein
MSNIKDMKQVKFKSNSNMSNSKAKSNMSTISISNSTKLTSKNHLTEILDYMDN